MPPTLALLRAYVFLRMIEIDFWSNYELSYYSWELLSILKLSLSYYSWEWLSILELLWVEFLFLRIIEYSWVIMNWVIILKNYWVFLSYYKLSYYS